jgi:hypothetical protein
MEPPDDAVYQSMVQPVADVALKVTAPPPQRELALGLVGAAGISLMVTTTEPSAVPVQPAADTATALQVPLPTVRGDVVLLSLSHLILPPE